MEETSKSVDRLVRGGRLLFAAALVAFGIEHILFGEFITGRAPAWPPSIPGRLVWAYLSGAILIGCGGAIWSGRYLRLAASMAGTLIFFWAFARHVPLFVADPTIGGAWTNAGKALALSTGAFAVAGSVHAGERRFPHREQRLNRLKAIATGSGRFGLGLYLVLAGIQHFLFAGFVATLVPSWIPGGLFWTYLAGVALIAGGLGLFFTPATRLAGLLVGLMIFIWFIVLHIPRAFAFMNSNEWIAVFEALAFSSIAFVLAGSVRQWIRQPA